MYKVYLWTNRVNNKKYVGVTSTSLMKRAGKDGYHYKGSPRFYAAIQKYGLSSFITEILRDGLTKEEAATLEREYIETLQTMNPLYGYNLQAGGFPCAVEDRTDTASKISATLHAQRSTDAYRAKMSARMLKVWRDPVRKQELLKNRAGKYAGRRAVEIFCEETNTTYPDMHKAGKELGVSCATISRLFSLHGDTVVIGSRKSHKYTIHKIQVHNKESELLEAPTHM